MTLEPFALLCKISKWTSAWRKKTSFDRKAALLSSEKAKLSDETLAARWSLPLEEPVLLNPNISARVREQRIKVFGKGNR